MNKALVSLLAVTSVSAQMFTFTIDTFDQGNFSQSAPMAEFSSVSGDPAHILGGERHYKVEGTMSMSVANGEITTVGGNSAAYEFAYLRYGSMGSASDHLHLDLRDAEFFIDVTRPPEVVGQVWVSLYAMTDQGLVDAGNYSHFISPGLRTYAFHTKYFGYWDKHHDIAAIGLNFHAPDNLIEFDNFRMTAIPEPSTYAALFGVALLSFAIVRRARRYRLVGKA